MPSSGTAKNMGGTPDPNQPSPRAMHFIKNRNNITDLHLRRQLTKFSKEKAASMYNIDHARLDVKDFLRDVKYCASDNLPESKIWLGEKEEDKKKKEKKETLRSQTAPGSGAQKSQAGAADPRDIQTAPDQATGKSSDDMVKFGIFFKKRGDLDPNKVHRDIYSRRNMYSSIDRDLIKTGPTAEEERQKAEQLAKWNEEQEKIKAEEARIAEEKRKEEAARKKAEDAEHRRLLEQQRREMLQAEREDGNPLVDIRAEMRRIAQVKEPTELEKREARIRNMNANADLMKDILLKNAKKRAQRKKKRAAPVEDRIREFFTKIEVLRKQEEEDAEAGPTVEQQRRFILMTKGVKAALEFGANDQEDSPTHTL